jgi:hypothetical protein
LEDLVTTRKNIALMTQRNRAILDAIERRRAKLIETPEERYYVDAVGNRTDLTVTGVLSEAGFYRWFREDEEAAERGTVVHRILELYDEGDLDERSIDPELRPYFDAWLKALEFLRPAAMPLIEFALIGADHKVGGKIDRVVIEQDGTAAIWDIKTGDGAPARCWALQTIGYAELADVSMLVRRRVIQLHRNGQFCSASRIAPLDHRVDSRAWDAAARLALWKRQVRP